jgi:hypothetical protein
MDILVHVCRQFATSQQIKPSGYVTLEGKCDQVEEKKRENTVLYEIKDEKL